MLLRALADAAAKTLGKKIVVEDKPGAGGALAPTLVHTTGKPDGYLLTQMPQPILRIPHIQKTEFDVINDFTWIIRIVDYTYALIVRNESPLSVNCSHLPSNKATRLWATELKLFWPTANY